MGRDTFTSYSFETETRKRDISFTTDHSGTKRATESVAQNAKQQAYNSGKLHPSVDPATNPIHRSLIRFEPYEDKFRVTVGCPINIEAICDMTGSMGGNVQIMFGVLPETYDLISKVLPGCDPQLSLGVFGDASSPFPLFRPEFEMTAEKIVEYCSFLFANNDHNCDTPEDPQYAMYGAAYLTDAYLNRIGLRGYHFIITDSPMHEHIEEKTLTRLFGSDVLEYVSKNRHKAIGDTRDMQQLMTDLNRTCHAFLILVGSWCRDYWRKFYHDNIIIVESTQYLPQVEAAIIGLTEATIEPSEIEKFLLDTNVPSREAKELTRQLLQIPYGKQRQLEQASGYKIPKKGDLFASKQDLEPCGFAEDNPPAASPEEDASSGSWL